MSRTESAASPPAGTAKDTQRDMLAESEKKAAEPQPGSYKEEATEDKVVEIGADVTDDPIKGIDAP